MNSVAVQRSKCQLAQNRKAAVSIHEAGAEKRTGGKKKVLQKPAP